MEHSNSLIIACGAIAKEIVELKRLNNWKHFQIKCLPADLHNKPKEIAPAVKKSIESYREKYSSIFVAYADCGTGGELDKVLNEEKLERLPGAHCYEFFWGSDSFLRRHSREPGVFYLTDFLARNFDKLVIDGLGIKRYPELKTLYFKSYTKLIYLAQTESDQSCKLARKAADFLELDFEYVKTGYGDLKTRLVEFNQKA